jgi:hypothetical protein
MKRLLVAAAIAILFPIGVHAFTDSASFNSASSQYLSVSSFGFTGDLTVEGWVKITSQGSYDFIAKGNISTNNADYLLNHGDAETGLGFCVGNASGQTCIGSATQDLSTNTWYHIAGVYVNSTKAMTLYIDEVQVAAGTSVFALGNDTTPVYIGARKSNSGSIGAFLAGGAFMARVWNQALTTTQLTSNKCTELGSTANLAAEWTLDNTLADDSGNSNTLTNNNGVTFTADLPCTAVVVTPSIAYFNSFWW